LAFVQWLQHTVTGFPQRLVTIGYIAILWSFLQPYQDEGPGKPPP
jgi:hypothetical protein